ncbi:MAG: hypothetical protein EOP07_07160 [Proteobacteria bacterium]|nr:MAG: hypothetical protein EOP07_07160 [Pseudomonadota bacterium]
MKSPFVPLLFLTLALLQTSCALFGGQGPKEFDERSFSVLNLNVFNQRTPSSLSNKNWKGDWLFRRERLELIDEQLRITRPDIIVFQEVLTRRDSPSESDINILSAGALEGYEWDASLVQSYRDTQEMQYNTTAVGLPVKLVSRDITLKSVWPIGVDGAMSFSLLELDQNPIVLINLQMPDATQRADAWYSFVRTELRSLLKATGICPQRMIVSGHIPGSSIWKGYSEFLSEFNLKDTTSGFCEAASDCLTTSTQNDLFAAINNGQGASHSERVLVHSESIIFSSGTAMAKLRPTSVNGPQYGVHRLWASPAFGWETELRLARCSKSAD